MEFLHDLQWVLPWRSSGLTQLALGLSWLGYSTFIMFFMTLGYWAASRAVFTRLFVLVALNALVNAYAKDWFQDPRPPAALHLDNQIGETYGLPSGHAQLAVVLWLWLAWEIRRAWAWVAGTMVALGVMASRLYLGVHDVEDVLIGASLGGISLLLFATLHHKVRLDARWQRLALVLAIAGLAMLAWPTGTSVPTYVPLIAGWMAALVWLQPLEHGLTGLQDGAALRWRVATVVLGIACFYLEQKLLKFAGNYWVWDALSWNFAKGLANGAFVTLVMPWLLCHIRLPGTRQALVP